MDRSAKTAKHLVAAIALPALCGIDAAALSARQLRYHISLIGQPGVAVARAVDGALERLGRPQCRRLLDEFRDSSGRALSANVTGGQSPADALLDVHFADGGQTTQCRTSEAIALFTSPGSRVVFVCERQFTRIARTRYGEALVIHELLHVLGMVENSPSSAITAAVLQRCG